MKTVEYKGIKIQIEKLDNGTFVMEPMTNNGNKFKMYCDNDSERFLEKIYLMVKNPGTFVG